MKVKRKPKKLILRFTREITEIQSCPCWGDYVLCFREPVTLNFEKTSCTQGKKVKPLFFEITNEKFQIIDGEHTFKEALLSAHCTFGFHWVDAVEGDPHATKGLIELRKFYLENCYVKEVV